MFQQPVRQSSSESKGLWLWRWLPRRLSNRLSKCQSLSTTTVLFRTMFTWTIILNVLMIQKWLLGSNPSQLILTNIRKKIKYALYNIDTIQHCLLTKLYVDVHYIPFVHFSHYRKNNINAVLNSPRPSLVKLFFFYHSQYKTRLNSAFKGLFSLHDYSQELLS